MNEQFRYRRCVVQATHLHNLMRLYTTTIIMLNLQTTKYILCQIKCNRVTDTLIIIHTRTCDDHV